MTLLIPHFWILLAFCFLMIFIVKIIMRRQATHFLYMEAIPKRFSIIRLKLTSSSQTIIDLVEKINALPNNQGRITFKYLKRQLFTDFFFIPWFYGIIFLLCMKAACSCSVFGLQFLAALGWIQIVALLCDVLGNCYILNKISKPTIPSLKIFMAHRVIEILKWVISLSAVFLSCLSLLIYHFKI